MEQTDYAYSGLIASTWDLHRDTSARWEDSEFFLQVVRRYGEPVLDVGCGSGRVLLDYMAQGIDVDGVDNSPELLAIGREKAAALGFAPNLYQQPMQKLALPRSYRTILVPSSSFQLLTDAAEAAEAMRRFYAHLQPGGALVMSFGWDWVEGEPDDTGWQLHFEKVRPEDGAIVRSWIHSWAEPVQRYWHTAQRFEVEKDGVVIQQEEHLQSPEVRWYSQAQAVQVYRDAGFGEVHVYSGFTWEPARPEDRLYCVLGVK
jgi:ubiquinone/menaquinone biosynthesis C-methylase UbiE